jgi:manganese oxidase
VTATDGGEIPVAGQWPETTVLVPVGSTRTLEFSADALDDWPMHCHMTHHVMTQMGHDVPVMIGADARRINRRVRSLVPGYVSMGQNGMGDMGDMKMPVPENSTPMQASPGPFSSIDMGGMFTVLKVRANPESEDGKGWYQHPAGTVADQASAQDLAADGVDPAATK